MKRFEEGIQPGNANNALGDSSRKRVRLKARRKLWLEVHLWLGLVAGAVLVVVGLTGSILVFWQEFDGWLSPDLYRVERAEGVRPLPPTALDEAARTALPEGTKIGWVEFPRDSEQALNLSYLAPSVSMPGEKDVRQLFIDPFTGTVKGERLWYPADYFSGMPFMALMFKLHYALLMKDYGVVMVGILSVLLIISVLTGLILWWPLTGKWAQALTIKPRASIERFNFDLHKTSGFYTALVMLAVLLSGVSMNLPEYFNTLVEIFSPLSLPERVHSGPAGGREPIGWGRAAEIIEIRYPEGHLNSISPPADDAGLYNVCKNGVASMNRFVGYRCVWVDQYSGEILKVLDQTEGSAGDIFLQWQWPLHSGQAFGLTGRILVFLTGLACPVLYVTGLIRWLQKRAAHRR
ncbi:MAG: PepSY-associated TM helix domain-containing protein [Methylococcaceae bacterium]|nr:PepSY-associated TM helix domain-containing protein [Methylococcaceae bacterium]